MLEPATPKADEFGRLTSGSPLQPGWPCRWCGFPLRNAFINPTPATVDVLGCRVCDNPPMSERPAM